MQTLSESFQVEYDRTESIDDMLFEIVRKIRANRTTQATYDYFCWLTRASTTGRAIIDIANDPLTTTKEECLLTLSARTNLVGKAFDTYIQELYRKFQSYR